MDDYLLVDITHCFSNLKNNECCSDIHLAACAKFKENSRRGSLILQADAKGLDDAELVKLAQFLVLANETVLLFDSDICQIHLLLASTSPLLLIHYK